MGWTERNDTTITNPKHFVTTVGLTVNIGKLFKQKNCGLTAMFGLGYIYKNSGIYEYKSWRDYNNHLLEDTYVSLTKFHKGKAQIAYEMLLAYDLIAKGNYSFSILAGYNTGSGAQIGLAFAIAKGKNIKN